MISQSLVTHRQSVQLNSEYRIGVILRVQKAGLHVSKFQFYTQQNLGSVHARFERFSFKFCHSKLLISLVFTLLVASGCVL